MDLVYFRFKSKSTFALKHFFVLWICVIFFVVQLPAQQAVADSDETTLSELIEDAHQWIASSKISKTVLYRLIDRPGGTYGSLLFDADLLTPSFFKSQSSPQWRRVTKYPLDNQLLDPFFARFTFSSNLILDVSLLLNYHISYHAIRESFYAPELTFGFSHVFSLPVASSLLSFIENGSKIKQQLHLISLSAILAKSLSPTAKVFAGPRYTFEYTDVDLGIENDIPQLENKNGMPRNLKTVFDRKKSGTQLVVGITQISTTKRWENSFIMTTDFNKFLAFTLEAELSQSVVFGMTYEPYGVLVLRPYVKFRMRFPR